MTTHDNITAAMERLSLTFDFRFVPYSESRHADRKLGDGEPWKSLNYRATLKRDGRDVLTTDYSMGIGHCPAYLKPIVFKSGARDDWATDRAIDAEIETGRQTSYVGPAGNVVSSSKRILPNPADVLHTLLCDADVLDYASFEGWADYYGYSSDSISAKQTYDDCLATALKLRASLGEKVMAELRELFADY